MENKSKDYTEGNRKMATFMGAVVLCDYSESSLLDFGKNNPYPENSRYWSDTTLKYHKSWEWLTPVVAKLMKKFNDENDKRHLRLRSYYPFDLELLWDAVGELLD